MIPNPDTPWSPQALGYEVACNDSEPKEPVETGSSAAKIGSRNGRQCLRVSLGLGLGISI